MHRFMKNGRLCAVVAARTSSEALRQVHKALRYTTTVELRLDWLAGPAEVQKLLKSLGARRFRSAVEWIATCRRQNAGGKFRGSVIDQLRLLRSAIRAGCRWVDVEIETVQAVSLLLCLMYIKPAHGIVSFHDFRALPRPERLSQIVSQLNRICSDGPFETFKVAVKCASLRDSLRLLKIASRRSNSIVAPMGKLASAARILSLRAGSRMAYAPVEQSTAPGQISLRQFRELYRGGDFDSGTRVYGVIGNPVEHSLSPLLFNAGFQARKLNSVYLPFLVSDLRDFMAAVKPLGIRGFSVTLPFKQKLLRFLDGCDALADSIGAVNTVTVRADGTLIGYNTDSVGILVALKRQAISGSRILILGAGGAARAAAFTLMQAGASLYVCSRRRGKAIELARAVHGDAVQRTGLRKRFFDVIINATPVGMYPRERSSPLRASELNCSLAFDMVYRPRKTHFLRLAAERGIDTVSGLEMFLAQATAQWEIWTGTEAPRDAMRRAVEKALRLDERKKRT